MKGEQFVQILEKTIYGLLMGLSHLFPVSALAHGRIYSMLTGMEESSLWSLCTHLGILVALFVLLHGKIRHMQREIQIAGAKRHRRLRQPDMAAVSDYRLLLTGCVPMIAALIFGGAVTAYLERLWIIALLLVLNGMMLYILQFRPEGTRGSLSMSPFDGLLLGLCSFAAFVPGLSRISCFMMLGQRRGIDRSYLTDLALLMSIPWVLGLIVLDLVGLFSGGLVLSLITVISALLCSAAAFGGAYGAAALMQYLAVRIGFHSFAFYSCGIGFVCFILYLMI